jgi:predicted AAA+ superfamily ATPase
MTLSELYDGAQDPPFIKGDFKKISKYPSSAVKVWLEQRHLNSLEDLLLICRLPSVSNQRARPSFRIFDSGVISFLTHNLEEREVQHSALVSFVLNEILAQHEYAGNEKARIFHYRERGGAELDLVLETGRMMLGIECVLSADVSEYRQRGMKSFLNKHPRAKGIFVAPVTEGYKLSDRMRVVPWGCVG